MRREREALKTKQNACNFSSSNFIYIFLKGGPLMLENKFQSDLIKKITPCIGRLFEMYSNAVFKQEETEEEA